MSPEQLAAERLAAIEKLEQQLLGQIDAAQRELYERLLSQLNDIQADPSVLIRVLADYQAATLVPLAAAYGQAMLHLPALNVAYFEALDVAGYQKLRAPLTDFLTARLGIDATGAVVPGGFLDLMAGNTLVREQVLRYAYSAQAGSAGITAYREGLRALVLGNYKPAQGLVQDLYRAGMSDFTRNDRALQTIAGTELKLTASLYQGGLILGSRPFCKVRNGKVFLDSEVAKFGTKEDAYGGYTNKSLGEFSGKNSPYTPEIDLGGHECRHSRHYIPSVIALRMRPDLKEDSSGKLYIAA